MYIFITENKRKATNCERLRGWKSNSESANNGQAGESPWYNPCRTIQSTIYIVFYKHVGVKLRGKDIGQPLAAKGGKK